MNDFDIELLQEPRATPRGDRSERQRLHVWVHPCPARCSGEQHGPRPVRKQPIRAADLEASNPFSASCSGVPGLSASHARAALSELSVMVS